MGKIDPRVIKTRRKLKNAFLQLLTKHNLGEINVKDLTQTADVTRGTFYLHYKDKETFIQKMMRELIVEFFEAAIFSMPSELEQEEAPKIPVLSLLATFEYVDERPDFFIVLLKEADATIYRDEMSEQFYAYIEEHRHRLGMSDNKVPKELLMNFLMYSILGVADGWLANGKIYAHHFMAENVQKLLNSQLIDEAGLTHFFVTDKPETV